LKRWIYIFLLIVTGSTLPVALHAQTFKVNLSPKHLAKLNTGKSAHEKLKMYRKFYSKDSTQQMKKHSKFYQNKFDSVSRANRKQERFERRAARKGIKSPFDTIAFVKTVCGFASPRFRFNR
jgi:hypothetical protein